MIHIRDATYRYPDGTLAVGSLDLRVERGRALLLAGPNGSGKSTAARLMNGLLKPTSGDVLVDGVSTSKDDLRSRRRVGLVFQEAEDQIVADTVERDVAFGPENLGLPRAEVEERVEEALRLTGLEELRDRSPHLLSGGQRRRVALAGVMAMRPECVVLDEPLSGLDAPSRDSLLAELERLREKGFTLVIISQELTGLWRLVDEMAVMRDGELVEQGDPLDVVLRGVERYGVREPAEAPILRALRSDGVGDEELRDVDMEDVARWLGAERAPVRG